LLTTVAVNQECKGCVLLNMTGQSYVPLTYSSPCRNPHAAAV
jgi:hypothetical protein